MATQTADRTRPHLRRAGTSGLLVADVDAVLEHLAELDPDQLAALVWRTSDRGDPAVRHSR